MKVKIFSGTDPNLLEQQINEFLKNVRFIGVEWSVSTLTEDTTQYAAIIIYTESLNV